MKVKREASGGTSREFRETSGNLGEGTADAAGRAEVLRGEVQGMGVCRRSDGREG